MRGGKQPTRIMSVRLLSEMQAVESSVATTVLSRNAILLPDVASWLC